MKGLLKKPPRLAQPTAGHCDLAKLCQMFVGKEGDGKMSGGPSRPWPASRNPCLNSLWIGVGKDRGIAPHSGRALEPRKSAARTRYATRAWRRTNPHRPTPSMVRADLCRR